MVMGWETGTGMGNMAVEMRTGILGHGDGHSPEMTLPRRSVGSPNLRLGGMVPNTRLGAGTGVWGKHRTLMDAPANLESCLICCPFLPMMAPTAWVGMNRCTISCSNACWEREDRSERDKGGRPPIRGAQPFPSLQELMWLLFPSAWV